MVKFLSLEEILFLHHSVIEDFGGLHGVKDEGRLLSAVASPMQQAFGEDLYISVLDKCAVIMRNIIGGHPFVDGNKRTAVTVGGVFLMRNHIQLACSPKELEDFAVQIAVEHLTVKQIASWLKKNSKKS